MLPTVVAAFMKKWFDDSCASSEPSQPRFLAMPRARYRRMMKEWQRTVDAHLPSAGARQREALNSVLYALNITLRVTD